jgi:large subunit ribosomal protein L21
VLVGTPTIGDILVKVTVVDHTRGPKIDRFKYRPKKRIRVRGGHRQQFTRLLVDFIGRPDEDRKVEVEKSEPVPAVEEAVAEKAPKARRQAKAKEEAPKSTKKTSAKAATTTKSSSKKTDSKKK